MTSLIASSCFPNLDPTILNAIGISPSPAPAVQPAPSTKSKYPVNKNGQDYTQAYPLVKAQNVSLENTINTKHEMYSTDNQQFVYKYDKYNSLVSANYFLFIVYVCIGCFLVIFLTMTEKLSTIPKILIILLFAIYPFVIFYIENYAYTVWLYLYSVMSGESYWDMNKYSREQGTMY